MGFLIVALSSALALLLVEVSLRVAGIGSDQFLQPDRVLGVRFIPSKSGLSQGECYRARVTTNAQGWRGRAVSVEKPDGVYRVLVLGDSFVAALQVENDATFPSVLEGLLNRQKLPRHVEVINFGVPSWGTDQEYLALREYGRSLKPDLIVVAFYAQNDVSDNSSVLQAKASTYPKPFFDLKDGELFERPFSDPTPTVIALGRRLAAPLRLYPLARDSLLRIPVVHRLLYRLGIVGVVPRAAEEDGREPTSPRSPWPGRWRHQLGVYKTDYPKEWIQAWAITEGLLAKARDEAQKAGAELLLVQVADPVVVMPPALRRLVAGGSAETLDVDKPTRLLESLAEKRNIAVMSLTSGFRARIADSETEFEKHYLSCDGHWTAAGHRLAAELVAPEIEARIARAGR